MKEFVRENTLTPSSRNKVSEIRHFLDNGSTEAFKTLLPTIRAESDIFQKEFEGDPAKEITLDDADLFNTWIQSPKGKDVVSQLTAAVTLLAEQIDSKGVPGHDKRHVIIKDLTAGLRYSQEDDIQDWRKLFLIPSLFHDFGRLVEGRFSDKIMLGVLGVDHPKFGYYFTNQILELFPQVPQKLRNHLLYAIIVHMSGGGKDSFIAQAVQRSDREQLVGPEGVLRMLLCDTGMNGADIYTKQNPLRKTELPLPSKPNDMDVMHHIEFYMRNLFENKGSQGEQRADRLKEISGTFLALQSTNSPEMREQFFYPEMQRDNGEPASSDLFKFKKPLKADLWEKIKQNVNQLPLEIEQSIAMVLNTYTTTEDLLVELYRAPGAVVTTPIVQEIDKKIGGIPQDKITTMKHAFAYILVMRDILDQEDKKVLRDIIQTSDSESLEYQMATLALESWTKVELEPYQNRDKYRKELLFTAGF